MSGSVDIVDTEVSVGKARTEFVGATLPYNKLIRITVLNKGSGAKGFDGALSKILKSRMANMGNVQLVSVRLNFMATAEGASVYAGFCNANKSISAERLGMTTGGLAHVASAFNVGTMHSVDLVIPGFLSRQIQPASTEHPEARIVFTASKSMMVTIEFALHYDLAMIVDEEDNFE